MGEEVPKDIPGLFLYLIKKRFDTLEEDRSVKFNEINEKLKVLHVLIFRPLKIEGVKISEPQ